METIQIDKKVHPHNYSGRYIHIKPDPPVVGVKTKIAILFRNPGKKDIVIDRVQFMFAAFGIGAKWELLPPLEAILLPAHSYGGTEVAIQWTPTYKGHCCVRAIIESSDLSEPISIGRNLMVIEGCADETVWYVPFRLGNPEDERMPIQLKIGGVHRTNVSTVVWINQHPVRLRQPIWLEGKEEVDAMLVLRAHTEEAIKEVKTVEAFIQRRFIDGIQVELYRPAYMHKSFVVENPLIVVEETIEHINAQ